MILFLYSSSLVMNEFPENQKLRHNNIVEGDA